MKGPTILLQHCDTSHSFHFRVAAISFKQTAAFFPFKDGLYSKNMVLLIMIQGVYQAKRCLTKHLVIPLWENLPSIYLQKI